MNERRTAVADVFAHHFTVAQHQAEHHDPDRATKYRARMADLRTRYPNQWVVYTDQPDEPVAQTWKVVGTFADEQAAVDCGMTVPPEQRSAWTVCFVGVPAGVAERVTHPQAVAG